MMVTSGYDQWETADPAARLWIRMHGHARHAIFQKALESGFAPRIINSINASPGFCGFGVNLKKLFG